MEFLHIYPLPTVLTKEVFVDLFYWGWVYS